MEIETATDSAPTVEERENDPQKKSLPEGDIRQYIESVLGREQSEGLMWVHTHDIGDGQFNGSASVSGWANTVRINDIRRINKYFEFINRKSDNGDYLIATVETKEARKERLYDKFPVLIRKPYYFLDFILKRVFPKWKPTRAIYFHITKGRNRVLSLTESLGRLVSCGYEIVDHKKIKYNTWIIAKKVKDPGYDMQPTYGALVRLDRVGHHGKLIKVCKLRTMYPYSEYLQEYIYQHNDIEEGGKFKNDFRNTSYGHFFRKYWLDEFPMFINFFKGEMKLVGVRPLSRHYFRLYPEDLQELRTKIKPGLVPPYYADMPEGLDEIQESERNYLQAYLKNPVQTDIRYFFKSFYNILFKGARSK
jgi:lipopolysaccharide/colanic/teichoic acid biosynthesis glycosyltransferase